MNHSRSPAPVAATGDLTRQSSDNATRSNSLAARGRKYEARIAELSEATVADLRMIVGRAVMLSMSLTGTMKHCDGSDAWTHDDYDVAHAALNELVRRAR